MGHVDPYLNRVEGHEVQVDADVWQVRHVGSQAVHILVARWPYIPTGQFPQVNVGKKRYRLNLQMQSEFPAFISNVIPSQDRQIGALLQVAHSMKMNYKL